MKKQIIIVIAVLATASLVTWGIVSHRTARRISLCNACIGNQRMIDSAKEQWAMQTKTKSGPIDMQAVLFYIKGGKITKGSGVTSKHRTLCLQCIGGCGGMETWPDPCE